MRDSLNINVEHRTLLLNLHINNIIAADDITDSSAHPDLDKQTADAKARMVEIEDAIKKNTTKTTNV